MFKALTRTKPAEPEAQVGAAGSVEGESSTLKRTLSARHLILLGIGAVIGAGIFVLTGQAAAVHAGPAVVISFLLAGFTCALAGLCYAEFSAMMPVTGSAYSYSYTTLGEGVAWLIGWCLILEYLFAGATVAVGWSAYAVGFLTNALGVPFPDALANAPLSWSKGELTASGAIINLPALLLVIGISGVLYRGITQSAVLNSVMVVIKLVVVFLFIGFGSRYVDSANWHPFIPQNTGTGEFGWSGIFRAASIVFFAYIGFDAVSTAAGETKNPQRDMPIGILGSLAICTVIYVIVCAVLTGLMPYPELNTARPVATSLEHHPQLAWLRVAVEIGAIAGLFSVVLVLLMGQPRIFFAMSQDGLIPKVFSKVHPKYHTPYIGTIFVGILAAALAGLVPLNVLGELVSMGTLLAFATVSIGVLVLRFTRPELKRPFRVPGAIIVCPLGAAACLYLFSQAFAEHWKVFLSWIVLGVIVYFGYSIRHSRLNSRAG